MKATRWNCFGAEEGEMKAVRTETRDLMEQATERAVRYLETLEARRVFPTVEAVSLLTELGGPFPAGGSEPTEVLRLLDEIGYCSERWAAVFWVRYRRRAACNSGGELAGGSLGPVCRSGRTVTSEFRAGGDFSSVAYRTIWVAARMRGWVCDRRDDGELHSVGCGEECGTRARGMGCGSGRADRRAEDHSDRRRGDSHQRGEGARNAWAWAKPNCACARGLTRTDACRIAAPN